ncbi:MAG TPA: macro domain-containing protein [Longilinea sp.]|nr:macro domain-containing protein [Longilinea sp.]
MSLLIVDHSFPTGQHLQIVQGDLTRETTDAIVNAANSKLQHGGGIAGAILRNGGYEIQRESDLWIANYGLVDHAHPAVTSGGNLPARIIIHAVGPVWGSGDEDVKLESAYRGSYEKAEELKLGTLAVPALSTGVFGFPKQRAARIFFATTAAHFRSHPESSLKVVRLEIIDEETLNEFLIVWRDLHPSVE